MNNNELYEFIEKIIRTNELNRVPEQYGGGKIFSKWPKYFTSVSPLSFSNFSVLKGMRVG